MTDKFGEVRKRVSETGAAVQVRANKGLTTLRRREAQGREVVDEFGRGT